MRDFLDSLIDRHFDAAPQIRPRLPSLFEPEIPQSSTNFGVSGESGIAVQPEEFFVEPSARPKEIAATTAQSMKPHSTRLTRPFGLPETEVSSQSTFVREINPGPQQSMPKMTVNEWVNPAHGPGGDRERKMSGDHQEPLRKKEGMAIPLPNKSHPSVEQDTMQHRLTALLKWPAEQEKKNLAPATQRSLEQTPAMRSAHHVEKADHRPSSVEGSSEISPFIQPPATLIAPVIPPAVRPEKAISQPMPVINVTIGRIEVRATMSPQKQMPKPVNRPSVMGLEEYLRRRSGGRD
jgi:hypothetical protein